MATTKKTTEVTNDPEIAIAIAQDMEWEQLRNRDRAKETAETQASLSEQFPPEVHRQLKKGGTYLTYIPISEVITRLNDVLGFDGWSYEIVKCERDNLDPDFIVAHVRLQVYPKGERYFSVIKDGFGGQKIKRTKQRDIVDLGDEFKGAVSDALKKAAQAFGVGLYLARTEEAMEAVNASAPEPVVDPKVSELWENFISLSKTLDANGKSELNTFWNDYSKGKAKPTKQTATEKELEELIGECIRISFNGTEEVNG